MLTVMTRAIFRTLRTTITVINFKVNIIHGFTQLRLNCALNIWNEMSVKSKVSVLLIRHIWGTLLYSTVSKCELIVSHSKL